MKIESLLLPDSALVEILEFVTMQEGRCFLETCQDLWKRRKQVESKRQTLLLRNSGDRKLFLHYPLWPNLRYLDIGKAYSTTDVLEAVARYTPNLQSLILIGSTDLNDELLLTINQNHEKRQNLQYLDITFCRHVTYQSTLRFRKAMHYPKFVLRRQPAWMDGHFHTPFEDDGVHTYYADGSFSFARSESSMGFVDELWPWDDGGEGQQNHLGDRLKYIDLVSPTFFPIWGACFYRPGVSLLRIEDDPSTVLVAQSLRGMYPPRDFPKACHSSLPIGVSKHFTTDGRMVIDNNEGRQGQVMVTRMRKQPLEKESLMPPHDLVEAVEHFLENQQPPQAPDGTGEMTAQLQRGTDRLLHFLLGGSVDDNQFPGDDPQAGFESFERALDLYAQRR